jgi:hypothetical protein
MFIVAFVVAVTIVVRTFIVVNVNRSEKVLGPERIETVTGMANNRMDHHGFFIIIFQVSQLFYNSLSLATNTFITPTQVSL